MAILSWPQYVNMTFFSTIQAALISQTAMELLQFYQIFVTGSTGNCQNDYFRCNSDENFVKITLLFQCTGTQKQNASILNTPDAVCHIPTLEHHLRVDDNNCHGRHHGRSFGAMLPSRHLVWSRNASMSSINTRGTWMTTAPGRLPIYCHSTWGSFAFTKLNTSL